MPHSPHPDTLSATGDINVLRDSGVTLRLKTFDDFLRRASATMTAGSSWSYPSAAMAARFDAVHVASLRRSDGEKMPFARHTLELVNAALLELEP